MPGGEDGHQEVCWAELKRLPGHCSNHEQIYEYGVMDDNALATTCIPLLQKGIPCLKVLKERDVHSQLIPSGRLRFYTQWGNMQEWQNLSV